jgi:uncharacterized Tic20 family protein
MSTEPTPPPPPAAPQAQPAPAAPGVPSIPSTQDERTMALLCHLGGVIGSFLLPLIIWLIKKDQSKFVDDQGKEALNFHISLFILHVIAGFTICFTAGILNIALWVFGLVFSIIAGLAANKGEVYRYPVTIRLLK